MIIFACRETLAIAAPHWAASHKQVQKLATDPADDLYEIKSGQLSSFSFPSVEQLSSVCASKSIAQGDEG